MLNGSWSLFFSVDHRIFKNDEFDDAGAVFISDYKTGRVPDPKYVEDDEKLFAYALMLKEDQQKTTSTLELYYLSTKVKHTIKVTQNNLENAQQVIVRTRVSIDESCKTCQFKCNVTNLCNWCYYKKIDVCPAHRSDSGLHWLWPSSQQFARWNSPISTVNSWSMSSELIPGSSGLHCI